MAKYNWQELKKEYVLGNYKSVSEFLKIKDIPNNGSSRKQTSGWSEEKRQKQDQKNTKTIEKVIEKESTRDANIVISVQNTANELLKKIYSAIEELNRYTAKNTKKTKVVEYDYTVGKPSKETTEEEEKITEYYSIIDRNGLKQLTSALKDVNDIVNRNDNKDVLEKLDALLEEQKNA